jgi:hypothetical protein
VRLSCGNSPDSLACRRHLVCPIRPAARIELPTVVVLRTEPNSHSFSKPAVNTNRPTC